MADNKLSKVNQLISKYGGKCTSSTCTDENDMLEFVCKDDHKFTESYQDVCDGRWCIKCKKIQILRQIDREAPENDCICLDNEYENFDTPINWACKRGHLWKRSWRDTKPGNWCTRCEREKPLISKINKMVESKCGTVIYKSPVSIHVCQIFICKHDHMWKTTCKKVLEGSWCRECRNEATLEVARNVAKRKLGHCLSEKYIGADKPLLWECYYGHTWKTRLLAVKNANTWCPKCKINIGEEITRRMFEILLNENFVKVKPKWLQGLELDGFSEKLKLAWEYDGEQHYKFIKFFHRTQQHYEYRLGKDKLKTKLCEENNVILIRVPYYVGYDDLSDYIVKQCVDKNINVPNSEIKIDYRDFTDIYKLNDLKLQKLRTLIEQKNGKLRTDYYISNNGNIEVECDNNHKWTTTGHKIKSGYWCPDCVQKRKHTIEEMQSFAIKKNGKCLSKEYVNNSTKLSWECDLGHQWKAVPKTILNGHWCPKYNEHK